MAGAVMALVVLETVLAISSWVFSALFPDLGLSNLLAGEGIRWFFGHFSAIIASPLLAWLVLCASAVGCAVQSGLVSVLTFRERMGFRDRAAMAFVLAALFAYVGLIAALTLSPHAVLLSASGRLFPSPFSHGLVPVVAFGVTMCSVVFGVASGRILTVTDLFHSLYLGIEKAAPLFVVYIVLMQFCYSLAFVFSQNPNY